MFLLVRQVFLFSDSFLFSSPQRPQWLNRQFASSSSVHQLHRQNSAVDNIYQMYTGEDENVYESPQWARAADGQEAWKRWTGSGPRFLMIGW